MQIQIQRHCLITTFFFIDFLLFLPLIIRKYLWFRRTYSVRKGHNKINVQLISYKWYMKCTLVQWRLSIYPQCTQVAEGTIFKKSPVCSNGLCLDYKYRPSLEKRSHQLIVTLYTISMNPSVHNQLMRTFFEGQPAV